MSDVTPGLAPRKLELEEPMEMNVDVKNEEEVEPAVSSDSKQQPVEDEQETHETQAAVNPEATVNENQEQPMTEREQNRVQKLANERNQARLEADQYKAMLQNLVGAQTQPKPESPDEILAKQYKSFDPGLGYPTDPREYAHFNEYKARNAAREEYAKMNEQADLQKFMVENPEALEDDALLGAISAERAAAKRKGYALSYTEAAKLVHNKMEKRFAKSAAIQEQKDISDKNSAYVEGTRGGNPSRAPQTVDPEKMSLKEKEAWLKANGAW